MRKAKYTFLAIIIIWISWAMTVQSPVLQSTFSTLCGTILSCLGLLLAGHTISDVKLSTSKDDTNGN